MEYYSLAFVYFCCPRWSSDPQRLGAATTGSTTDFVSDRLVCCLIRSACARLKIPTKAELSEWGDPRQPFRGHLVDVSGLWRRRVREVWTIIPRLQCNKWMSIQYEYLEEQYAASRMFYGVQREWCITMTYGAKYQCQLTAKIQNTWTVKLESNKGIH